MLGACFWFNTMFAFNIFSAEHWRYLAGMQASRMAVVPGFYFSIVATVMIYVMGLYVIFKKRLRKIKLPMFDVKKAQTKTTLPQPAPARPQAQTTPPTPAPTQPVVSETLPTTPVAQTTTNAPQAVRRPPRLNLGMPAQNNTYAAAPIAPTAPARSQFAPVAAPAADDAIKREIAEIFESAGYTPKGTPRIKGMPTAIIAIAPDEVLWIGAVGATYDAMRTAVDTLARVFSETLDDIEININAFIIASPDTPPVDGTILMFANTSELREYMRAHISPPVPDTDDGGFDAYSAYISTVIDYIGKI